MCVKVARSDGRIVGIKIISQQGGQRLYRTIKEALFGNGLRMVDGIMIFVGKQAVLPLSLGEELIEELFVNLLQIDARLEKIEEQQGIGAVIYLVGAEKILYSDSAWQIIYRKKILENNQQEAMCINFEKAQNKMEKLHGSLAWSW